VIVNPLTITEDVFSEIDIPVECPETSKVTSKCP
jgi:hypothetical protein